MPSSATGVAPERTIGGEGPRKGPAYISCSPVNGVWALVRAANERHSISPTCLRACMVGTCGSISPSSVGTNRVACSLGSL